MALFDPTSTVKIKIDREIAEDFEALCEDRGLTSEQMFRVMLRSFTRRKVFFTLQDELNFGKYNGLNVEEVIRADPRYVNWLLRESNWFRLAPGAQGLLEELGEED